MQVGGAVGLAAAAILLPKVADSPPQPLNLLGGAAVGTAAGLLLHMVTRPAEYASPTKMLHELRH
jgi:CBS-domain-containing membrane protein